MQVAEAIVRILEKEGIGDAFGIPGAGINGVYKYLADSPIKHHIMRHEEAVVHAADGYFRSSGRMALAICTSGPGATNFITGLYTANIDSMPLFAITGQAVRAQLGMDAFQCVDIVSIASPIVKKAVCITEPEKIGEIMQDLFWTAREGRMGPVLLDVPLDVQTAEIDFDINSYQSKPIIQKSPDEEKIKKTIELLDAAEKPVIIMGGGVILSHAEKLLVSFAELMNIPVITTYMAKGGIPENHPLNAGQAGIQVGAISCGNEILLDSDVVLGIGCRFTDRHTGNISIYKGNRKFIHIDVDPRELGKLIKPEIAIESDAYKALESLLSEANKKGQRKGAARIIDIPGKKKSAEQQYKGEGEIIDPRDVFLMVNKVFGDDCLYTTGCGITQIWSGQLQKVNKPRTYLPSGGAGTLGFDIPAAIGASIGVGNKQVVCMMGDFGFTFMVEELAVVRKYELPIVVIIVNNAYLGLIRQNQKGAYKYEYEVALKENKYGFIDYCKVAEGFGCKAERVFSYDELEPAMKKAKESGQPYIVEVFVDDYQNCDMGNDIAHINRF